MGATLGSKSTITVNDPLEAVREWFGVINRNCPALDFDSTEGIFAPDVVGFGTKAQKIQIGLETLRQNQWEKLWPTIRDYEIDMHSVHGGGSEHLAWGVAVWTSTGFDEQGVAFPRPGRVTTVLEKRDGRWLSVHTHFSVVPGTPPFSYGQKQDT